MAYGKITLPWSGWEIEELIGSGSFGKVYRICKKTYGHASYAAVKVIKIPSDDREVKELEYNGLSINSYYGEMIEDLLKEISLMESLKGASNVVSIDDYALVENQNSVGWTLYIKMELLINLNQYREERPLDIEQILKLGIDICNALEACQKEGIVHRDIKPSNILVSKFEEFKLGDFGISRNLEHTMSGLSRKGTEGYMAPEVYLGKEYNSTVDIYSLGLVLYRLLNKNVLPFEPIAMSERTPKTLGFALEKRLRGETFPDPVMGEHALGDILRKACHIEPKQRYQTAGEFRQALREYKDGNRDSDTTVETKNKAADAKEEFVEEDTELTEHTWVAKKSVQDIHAEETEEREKRNHENATIVDNLSDEELEQYGRKLDREMVGLIVLLVAIVGIFVLALGHITGFIDFKNKKEVVAEVTPTPRADTSQLLESDEEFETIQYPSENLLKTDEDFQNAWEQVCYTLRDSVISEKNGIYGYFGKPLDEIEIYLVERGWYKKEETDGYFCSEEELGSEINNLGMPNIYSMEFFANGESAEVFEELNLGIFDDFLQTPTEDALLRLNITPEMQEWLFQDYTYWNGDERYNKNWDDYECGIEATKRNGELLSMGIGCGKGSFNFEFYQGEVISFRIYGFDFS